MNVLGIDLQRERAVACLREANASAWPPTTVADSFDSDRPDAAVSSPWPALRQRIDAFLGGAKSPQQPRRSVLALTPGGPRPDRVGAPGVECLTTVAAGRALLLAALQQPGPQRTVRRILAIVVADFGIRVDGYQVATGADGRTRVVAVAAPVEIDGTGAAFWVDEVVAAVFQQVSRAERVDLPLATLRASATELGARLVRAVTDERPVSWTGPLRNRMSAPLQFSRNACTHWSSVQRLTAQLPLALIALNRWAQGAGDPEIVIAGSGAGWPFAAALAAEIAPVTALPGATLALARGAALWPDVGEAMFDGCDVDETPQRIASTVSDAVAPVDAAASLADLSVLARYGDGQKRSGGPK